MNQQTPIKRYRPPKQVRMRALFVAAGAATVGSLEIIAGAGFGLPGFVWHAGIALLVVGVVLALSCLISYRSLLWTITAGDDGVRVLRSGGSQLHPWDDLNSAHVERNRLELWDRRGRRVEALPLGRAHAGTDRSELVEFLQAQIANSEL